MLAAPRYVLHRRSRGSLAPLTALTLPFRIPIATGAGQHDQQPAGAAVLRDRRLRAGLARADVVGSPRRQRYDAAKPRGASAAPLLFEKLLGAFIVLYAIQALYSAGLPRRSRTRSSSTSRSRSCSRCCGTSSGAASCWSAAWVTVRTGCDLRADRLRRGDHQDAVAELEADRQRTSCTSTSRSTRSSSTRTSSGATWRW